MKNIKFLIISFFLLTSSIYSQGLGVYGGYGLYNYNAAGLNNYIDVYNRNHPLLTTKMEHFGTSPGIIIGGTLEIGDYEEPVLALKVELTINEEKHTAKAPDLGDYVKREYSITVVGVKCGGGIYLPLNEFFSWTLNGDMAYNFATFKNTYSEPNGYSRSEELTGTGISFDGFTGLRLNLTSFFAIDGNVGLNYSWIPRLSFSNGNTLQRSENDRTEMDDFITGFGTIFNIQATLKIPFEMSDLYY